MSMIVFLSRTFAVILRGQSEVNWSTCVDFLMFQRSEKPQNLKFNRPSSISQLLQCEHLFVISDLDDPVFKLVCLVDERLQDVVELLHVFGSVSFTDVAD